MVTNLLLVVLDDIDPWLMVNCGLGNRMAAEGTTFPNYIITTPVCAPSRVSMLSGLYPFHHGVQDNESAFDRSRAIDHTFLPTKLPNHSGGMIGKYLNRYKEPFVPPGWQRWFGKTTLGMFNWEAYNGTNLRTFGNDPADYATDVLCDMVESFIHARATIPWFLMLSLNAPHSPYEVAHRHRDLATFAGAPRLPNFNEDDVSDKPTHLQLPQLTAAQIDEIDLTYRRRARMMATVSQRVGGILEMLPPDTLVVVVADNGFTVGTHRRPTGKGVAWEESTCVPLFVRGPGFAPGDVNLNLLANIDIGPFVLSQLTNTTWSGVDGTPFLGHDDVLIQSTETTGDQWVGVRTQTQVYVEHENGGREFYDLSQDPYQLSNAYSDSAYATAVAAMQQRLLAYGV